MDEKKTTTNLPANLASALCYAPFIGWIVALVMVLVEKNTEVKWHAVQGLLVGLGIWVLGLGLGMTVILAVLVPLIWVAGFILQLILVVKTYQGEKMKLPLLTEWTDKLVKKVK